MKLRDECFNHIGQILHKCSVVSSIASVVETHIGVADKIDGTKSADHVGAVKSLMSVERLIGEMSVELRGLIDKLGGPIEPEK